MTIDVTFEAVRKSDFAPFASMWLGQSGVTNVIDMTEPVKIEGDDCHLISLGNWKKAIDFLISIEDSFYIGDYGDEAIQFINKYQDQMAYFLRVG